MVVVQTSDAKAILSNDRIVTPQRSAPLAVLTYGQYFLEYNRANRATDQEIVPPLESIMAVVPPGLSHAHVVEQPRTSTHHADKSQSELPIAAVDAQIPHSAFTVSMAQ